jgi:hypothetical protein
LTNSVAALDPKNYLGQGQLLNGGITSNNARGMSPEEKKIKADALYTGPAGSHLGPGRILNDGTLDRNAPGLERMGSGGRSPAH